MFDVAAATTFDGVGASQSYSTDDKGVGLYRGNASTVDAPSGKITYNPRDGIFTVALTDAAAGVTRSVNFQDPGHRSTVDSARSGEYQVPLLPGFNYLQALDGDASFTFFYQRPGTSGSFVSLAGFERSSYATDSKTSEQNRGVLVFGARTATSQVPTTGSAHFDGEFLATMVGQTGGSLPILQWINGASAVDVDFAKQTLSLGLTGAVGPAFVKTDAIPDAALSIPNGTSFTAQGLASWTAASTAFSGKFTAAAFGTGAAAQRVDFTSVSAGGVAAGASSIDGAFYGPAAKNIGGDFRIVGGLPDQRVDILGGFVGAKK